MFKKFLQNMAILAMIISIFGGTATEDVDTNKNDVNIGIEVCGDLEPPIVKH